MLPNDSAVVVYVTPPDFLEGTEEMRFRLTYRGPLKAHRAGARGDPDKMAPYIMELRRHFHPQLRDLWKTNHFLSEYMSRPSDHGLPPLPNGEKLSLLDIVSQSHRLNGFNYVPLVRGDWHLDCNLSILILRRDHHPGLGLVHHGDLDNRLKTLIDALRYPNSMQELGAATPLDGEDPFYCLLQDDKYITGLSVESGQLLDAALPNENEDTVMLVIGVEIRPYRTTMFNLSLG